MSELLPKIARITRLLPQEDGRSDHADAARILQKTEVAVTQPLSFPLYTKIPASGERVNWKLQSGFPSKYFASHSIHSKMKTRSQLSRCIARCVGCKDQFEPRSGKNSTSPVYFKSKTIF